MITVEKKLETFSEKILENVNKETELKYNEVVKKREEYFKREQDKALEQAEQIITEAKKKAETKKKQTVYKALMEKDRTILTKKYELFQKLFSEIVQVAKDFTKKPEYENFLIKTLTTGIMGMASDEGLIFLKVEDKEKYGNTINTYLTNNYPIKKYKLVECQEDIIGGCVVEDDRGTHRVDCSISTMLEDNKELMGEILNENI